MLSKREQTKFDNLKKRLEGFPHISVEVGDKTYIIKHDMFTNPIIEQPFSKYDNLKEALLRKTLTSYPKKDIVSEVGVLICDHMIVPEPSLINQRNRSLLVAFDHPDRYGNKGLVEGSEHYLDVITFCDTTGTFLWQELVVSGGEVSHGTRAVEVCRLDKIFSPVELHSNCKTSMFKKLFEVIHMCKDVSTSTDLISPLTKNVSVYNYKYPLALRKCMRYRDENGCPFPNSLEGFIRDRISTLIPITFMTLDNTPDVKGRDILLSSSLKVSRENIKDDALDILNNIFQDRRYSSFKVKDISFIRSGECVVGLDFNFKIDGVMFESPTVLLNSVLRLDGSEYLYNDIDKIEHEVGEYNLRLERDACELMRNITAKINKLRKSSLVGVEVIREYLMDNFMCIDSFNKTLDDILEIIESSYTNEFKKTNTSLEIIEYTIKFNASFEKDGKGLIGSKEKSLIKDIHRLKDIVQAIYRLTRVRPVCRRSSLK